MVKVIITWSTDQIETRTFNDLVEANTFIEKEERYSLKFGVSIRNKKYIFYGEDKNDK